MDAPKFTIIQNPGMRDLQKAAYRFNCIAEAEGFQIAFVGGFAAKMMGSKREIEGLEVLIEPRFYENESWDQNSLGRRVVRHWSESPTPDRPYLAKAIIPARGSQTPGTMWPIVVSRSAEKRGIPIYAFRVGDKRECYRDMTVGNIPGSNVLRHYSPMHLRLTAYNDQLIPVLQAPALIEQRLLRLSEQTQDNDTTECDIMDIRALLDYAISTCDLRTQMTTAQLFSVEMGRELLPLVRKILHNAEAFGVLTTRTEVNKWRSINIELGIQDINS